MLVDLQLIAPSPADVAAFLFLSPRLPKRQVGRILADPAQCVPSSLCVRVCRWVGVSH
jgi:hypothetical protein